MDAALPICTTADKDSSDFVPRDRQVLLAVLTGEGELPSRQTLFPMMENFQRAPRRTDNVRHCHEQAPVSVMHLPFKQRHECCNFRLGEKSVVDRPWAVGIAKPIPR